MPRKPKTKELVNTRLASGYGRIHISFDNEFSVRVGKEALITVKNRLCCPNDNSPLFTILKKKLTFYKYEVLCSKCNTKYKKEEYIKD